MADVVLASNKAQAILTFCPAATLKPQLYRTRPLVILRDILEFCAPLGGENPYCYRWVLNLGLVSIRLHHWIADDSHEHDHPYWMGILCFAGGYEDHNEDGVDQVRAPAFRLRRPSHRHKVITKHAWTLVVTGPKLHRWHLYKNGKKYKPAEYFRKHVN